MVAVGSCAAQCIGAGPARSAASRRACARRAAEQRTQASAVARDGYVDGCGSCTRARKQQPRFTLCMIDIEAMDSSIVSQSLCWKSRRKKAICTSLVFLVRSLAPRCVSSRLIVRVDNAPVVSTLNNLSTLEAVISQRTCAQG